MAFLGALAGLSALGSAADTAEKYKVADTTLQLKQAQNEIRELQVMNQMQHWQGQLGLQAQHIQDQQASQGLGDVVSAGMGYGLPGAGGGPPGAVPPQGGPSPGLAAMPPGGAAPGAAVPPGLAAPSQNQPVTFADRFQAAQGGPPQPQSPQAPPQAQQGASQQAPTATLPSAQPVQTTPQGPARPQPAGGYQPGKLYMQASPESVAQISGGAPPPTPQQQREDARRRLAQGMQQQQQKQPDAQQQEQKPATYRPISPEEWDKIIEQQTGAKKGSPQFEAIKKKLTPANIRAIEQERRQAFKAAKEEHDETINLSPKAIDQLAESYYETGKIAGVGSSGRKSTKAERDAVINRAQEMHPDDPIENWPTNWQAYQTRAAGMRVVEQRTDGLLLAANEAARTIPRVRDAAKGLDITQFQDLNKIIEDWRTRTGDPRYLKLGQQMAALANIYARVLKPVGVVGVTEINDAARKLQPYWSEGQINGVLDQINTEIQAAREGIDDTRSQLKMKPLDWGTTNSSGQATPELPPTNQFQEGQTIKEKGTDNTWTLRNGKWERK